MRPITSRIVSALLFATALCALSAPSRGQDEKKDPKKEEKKEEKNEEKKFDNTEYLRVRFSSDYRFGFILLGDANVKQLTYAPDGSTNNVVIRINGKDFLLHMSDKADPLKVTPPAGVKALEKDVNGRGWTCTWEIANPKISITQEILLRRGPQSRKFDTAVVSYTFKNDSKAKQKVGLRFMLDTFIGANDGVPFAVPEQADLVQTWAVFAKKTKNLPDYIQAFESPDIKNPGTIAHVGVKVSGHLGMFEPPEILQISRWQHPDRTGWNIPTVNFGDDSMVGMYWEEASVEPGRERAVGFTYGLAKVSSGGSNGKMGLTVGGNFKVGGIVTLTAYLDKNLKKPTVALTLPEGLTFVPGNPEKRTATIRPGDPYGRLSWRIKGDKPGPYEIKAVLDDGSTELLEMTVK